jgi:acetyl esterase
MKLLCLLAACAIPMMAQLSYPPDMPEANRYLYRSVDGVDLDLFVFEPEGHIASDQTPAVVFFFGGGWNSGSPAQFYQHGKYLASRGMVAIAADYRVKSRHAATASQCVEDAKAAMRWVRSHAASMGIDGDRIAAGGGSAGGHLAAAVATLPGYDAPSADLSVSAIPNALVLFNPVTIVAPVAGKEELTDDVTRFRDRMGTDPESLLPYHHVAANLPPTILFHGKADTTVPYETAVLFCQKLIENGGRCELESYEGKNHGFFNYGRDGNEAYVDTVHKMDQFFGSLGWLEGEPRL